jgi:DNA polymerase (family 10)
VRKLELDEADHLAATIIEALAPFCERIEVAGSIRRRRPVVGDIDIVCLPKPGAQARIRERCLRNQPEILQDGLQQLCIILGNKVQLDLWYATPTEAQLFEPKPGTWATRFFCRTGSIEFNIWYAQQAQARGHAWNPYWGLYRNGKCLNTPEEADLFSALAIDFIPPEKRQKQ